MNPLNVPITESKNEYFELPLALKRRAGLEKLGMALAILQETAPKGIYALAIGAPTGIAEPMIRVTTAQDLNRMAIVEWLTAARLL